MGARRPKKKAEQKVPKRARLHVKHAATQKTLNNGDSQSSRFRRRGIEGVLLELGLAFCGFKLHKYPLKKQKKAIAA